MDMIWAKIEEKFTQLQSAFRFFDKDNSGELSFNEWAIGIEGLGLKLTSSELRKSFKFLDIDGDGNIGFREFCQLSEEN